MNWRDFFFFSWLASDDENEELRRENQELRDELDRLRADEDDDDFDNYEHFDEEQ